MKQNAQSHLVSLLAPSRSDLVLAQYIKVLDNLAQITYNIFIVLVYLHLC